MTEAEARLSAGTRDASSFQAERTSGEPAGCTVAAPWKLIVAGGIGATSDRIPPGAPAPSPRPDRWPRHAWPSSSRVPPPRTAAGRRSCRPRRWIGAPQRGDIAEDGERRLGNLVPDLLGGETSRHRLAAIPGDRAGRALACPAHAGLLVLDGC